MHDRIGRYSSIFLAAKNSQNLPQKKKQTIPWLKLTRKHAIQCQTCLEVSYTVFIGIYSSLIHLFTIPTSGCNSPLAYSQIGPLNYSCPFAIWVVEFSLRHEHFGLKILHTLNITAIYNYRTKNGQILQ